MPALVTQPRSRLPVATGRCGSSTCPQFSKSCAAFYAPRRDRVRAAFFAAAERPAAPFVLTALRAAAARSEAGFLAAAARACVASAFFEAAAWPSCFNACLVARDRAGETSCSPLCPARYALAALLRVLFETVPSF